MAAHELNSKDTNSFCYCVNSFESSVALGSIDPACYCTCLAKTGYVEGTDMLKEPEENHRFIREKINQVLFLWRTELASNRALNSVQRSDCGAVSSGRKYKVP